MWRRIPWKLIGLAAIIALIGFLFVEFVDLPAVGVQLQTADWRYLALASMAMVAGLLAYAIRWRVLLAHKPRLSHTFHASNIGHAGNIILPARAGEAARIVVMGQEQSVSLTAATSSFVVERLLEQMMRLAALGGAVVYGVGLEVSTGTIIGGIAFLLLAFGTVAWLINQRSVVLAAWPPWIARFPGLTEERVRQSLHDLLDNLANVSAPPQLALVLLWSVVTWLCFGGFFFLTMVALGDVFAPQDQLAVALGALALSPPSAPTQPGIFHASVVVPLTAVGFLAESLTAYAVLLHILEMIWMIGLALMGLLQVGLSPRQLLQRNKTAAPQ